MKIEYTLKDNECGLTLKTILKDRLYVSNILRYNLIKYNKVTVNQKLVHLSDKLDVNDTISVILDSITDVNSSTLSFSDKFDSINDLTSLNILYEDEYLLIVNKKSNMPSHPSCNNYKNTLSNIVHTYLKKQNIDTIHLITRLDKNTSGICIFAKHKYIQELFIRKKEQIKLVKKYLAIVYGTDIEDHGIIKKNIIRDENSIILRRTCDDTTGDFAKTEYYTISRNYKDNYSVLEIILHTGRTHQIRVHMSSINHPLLGDDLYRNKCTENEIRKLISRQALHAYEITLNHPITNATIKIKAPIPDDIKKLI